MFKISIKKDISNFRQAFILKLLIHEIISIENKKRRKKKKLLKEKFSFHLQI